MPCVVVLGESGHGKSSLINSLLNSLGSASLEAAEVAEVGKSAGGVTKDVAVYSLPSLNLKVVDTPGFGCRHASLHKIIADVEAIFVEQHVRGLLVTCPVDSPRLMLGTHIVQAREPSKHILRAWRDATVVRRAICFS